MSPTNAHPQGELSQFFFAFLSALRPVLCLKKCFRKTCLHRGNYRVFFVFEFLVVFASPLLRDIFVWILVILGVFCGWGVPRRLGGVPLGARSPSEMIFGCFLEDFRLHLGTGGTLWGSFWSQVRKSELLC